MADQLPALQGTAKFLKYPFVFKCSNCNADVTAYVPRGTRILTFLEDRRRRKEQPIVCDRCGCKAER